MRNLKLVEKSSFVKKFTSMTENKNDKTKVDLGLLEEDDEFEEFPAEGTYLNLLVFLYKRCNLEIADSSIRLDRKG